MRHGLGPGDMGLKYWGILLCSKTKRWRWFQVIWNGFHPLTRTKEENPQNYYIYAPMNGKEYFILL
jgi:hypothetical protein